MLCGLRRQPKELIEQSGLGAHVGEENMLNSIEGALERARVLHTNLVHA